MAKLELTHHQGEVDPTPPEVVEVRVWGIAGAETQLFMIGSGFNFSATGNIWVEIIYSIGSVNLFYTRSFLHYTLSSNSRDKSIESLKRFASGEFDSYGFGDMLPGTFIRLKREKFTPNDETIISYKLEISADIGAVFSEAPPSGSTINIQLNVISLDAGVQFMRELIDEIDAVEQGKHPDPASLTPRSSEWPFAHQVNLQAYNTIAQTYREHYFSNPRLKEMFETWIDQMPRGGHVLDAGCGHGDPTIAHLLEAGFQITGVDLSSEMLQHARAKFPSVSFNNLPITLVEYDAEFDGACSLSSLLYLDPIDLYHGIYRLYRAIKPGGLLFLHAWDTNPGWRGLPYTTQMGQWMWSWTYGMEEVQRILEEHNYFKVTQAQIVGIKEEKEKPPSPEKTAAPAAVNNNSLLETHFKMPSKQPPYSYAIIARRSE